MIVCAEIKLEQRAISDKIWNCMVNRGEASIMEDGKRDGTTLNKANARDMLVAIAKMKDDEKIRRG